MEPDDFSKESFKKLLKEKEIQIRRRTADGIQDNENFKKLYRLLISYQNERPITDFKAILIKESDIRNLCEDTKEKLFTLLDFHDVALNNHILVSKELKILSLEKKIISDNNHARRLYCELSKEYCVFLITPKTVHYFLNGYDIGEAIFFTPEALNRYNELKDISKILEVFDEYRIELKSRVRYGKFFVSNSTKRALHSKLTIGKWSKKSEDKFLEKNKQLLQNKPEDRFREDLRFFLKEKLKVTLMGKEYILENFKRLDIFITDELGDLYLVEVKWVGISIHPSGNKIGTEYKAKHINPDAIQQSVDYIKELYDTGKKIKIGYLVVFDARNELLEDTVSAFNEKLLSKDYRRFYNKFKKIPDFRVENLHPA